jgi:hypothetical protein
MGSKIVFGRDTVLQGIYKSGTELKSLAGLTVTERNAIMAPLLGRSSTFMGDSIFGDTAFFEYYLWCPSNVLHGNKTNDRAVQIATQGGMKFGSDSLFTKQMFRTHWAKTTAGLAAGGLSTPLSVALGVITALGAIFGKDDRYDLHLPMTAIWDSILNQSDLDVLKFKHGGNFIVRNRLPLEAIEFIFDTVRNSILQIVSQEQLHGDRNVRHIYHAFNEMYLSSSDTPIDSGKFKPIIFGAFNPIVERVPQGFIKEITYLNNNGSLDLPIESIIAKDKILRSVDNNKGVLLLGGGLAALYFLRGK